MTEENSTLTLAAKLGEGQGSSQGGHLAAKLGEGKKGKPDEGGG